MEESVRHHIGYGRIRWHTDDRNSYGEISLFGLREKVRLKGMGHVGTRGSLVARLLNGREIPIGWGALGISADRTAATIDRFDVHLLPKMQNRTVTLYFVPH